MSSKRMILLPFIVITVTVTLIIPAYAPTYAGDVENGRRIFTLCASCHGPNGRGNEDRGAPRLQGQHDWYLVRQLENFRNGIRGTHDEDTHGKQMRQMAMTLENEQAIRDVVSYIKTLD